MAQIASGTQVYRKTTSVSGTKYFTVSRIIDIAASPSLAANGLIAPTVKTKVTVDEGGVSAVTYYLTDVTATFVSACNA